MDEKKGSVPPKRPVPISGHREPPSRRMPPAADRPKRPDMRSQTVRNGATRAPNHSVIAEDFHKRLRGKPTHAAVSHSWLGGLGGTIAVFLKLFFVIFLLIVFIVGGFGGGMLVGYIATAKPLSLEKLKASDKTETSFVYDINGTEIAKLTGSENIDRIFVPYGEVKGTYIDEAITSIEDERFYEHNGIDLQRIGSAILSALANGGTASHGGSTITQQTVKMISGQDQVSAQRKVQEWYLAMALEQKLSKDEIMEYYVNLAPMGNNYVGIQAAAQNYFGKDAKDLTLPECAFLAGIPKSPSYYNPLRESGRRNAMRRMRVVLQKMHELGKITDQQYTDALNTELVFKSAKTTTSTTVKSYFVEYAVDEVIADLQKERNLSLSMAETAVFTGGYKIYTTLEPNVQAALDSTFQTQSLFQADPAAIEDFPEKPQGGMVVINVATGAIAGMQGGYGEKTTSWGWNRAVDIARQPGSSIKPLIDYAPAFETKILVPTDQLLDKLMPLDDSKPGVMWPKDSDTPTDGLLTIRQSVVKSKNIVAVQVWKELGAQTALFFLSQVGIDRTTEAYPSTAIGGFNQGMSPLEMAAAYATFANNGVYRDPYAYTKVLDTNGDVVLEKTVTPHRVYSAETTFLMTNILQDVITGGTAANQVFPIKNTAGDAIDVAGKTGTTDENVDKWFCGFTPYYAASTWYGYDNNLRKTVIPKNDRNDAMKIWNDAMQKIHMDLAAASFSKPDDVVQLTICSQTKQLATDSCKALGYAITDYFIVGDPLTPTTECPGHLTPTPSPGVVPPA